MKPFGQLAAEEARSWCGTPFKWGQSRKGVGCDCKGLIQGVARELGRPEAESFYATFASYRVDRPVPASLLVEGFSTLFDQGKRMMPGDILLLKHGGRPAHMAIFVGNDRAVHAYPAMNGRVRERDIGVLFHKHPLHSIWRWRRCR
jgi:cell wall-associated NlpC family hydrolase